LYVTRDDSEGQQENKPQKRHPKTLPLDHTRMRLRQDEYLQPFCQEYLELLKSSLKQIHEMDQYGQPSRRYYTRGQAHDRRSLPGNRFDCWRGTAPSAGMIFSRLRT